MSAIFCKSDPELRTLKYSYSPKLMHPDGDNMERKSTMTPDPITERFLHPPNIGGIFIKSASLPSFFIIKY